MTEPVLINDIEKPGRGRLKVMLIVGLVLVLALGVVPKVLLKSGGGSGDSQVTVPPVASPSAAGLHGAASGSAAPATADGPHRDPFVSLIQAAAGGGGGGGGTAAPAAATAAPVPTTVPPAPALPGLPPGVTSPATVPPATAPAAAPTTTTTLPPPPKLDEKRLELLRVYTLDGVLTARLQLDDAVFEVTQGDNFFNNYSVVELVKSSRCGVFQYVNQQFALCEGGVVRF